MTNEINEEGGSKAGGKYFYRRANPEAGDESLHTANLHGPQRQKRRTA